MLIVAPLIAVAGVEEPEEAEAVVVEARLFEEGIGPPQPKPLKEPLELGFLKLQPNPHQHP